MSGSDQKNVNNFRFILRAAPVDPTTGKTVSGLKKVVAVFRTYDKASIALEKQYLNETDGGQTFWIEDRSKTRKHRT